MKILLPLVFALLLAGASAHAATASSRPNMLFVVVDDMNTDLGCYGNRVVKSPNIDRLAARGVRFDRAYCQYSLCNPSRTSFLSGRRPETSGVYVLNITARAAMPDAVMLPQLFRQNGYFCAGAGKVHHNANHREPESWDFYEDGKGEDAGEQNDLAKQKPEKVADLTRLHDAWLAEMPNPVKAGAKRWGMPTPESSGAKKPKRERKRNR